MDGFLIINKEKNYTSHDVCFKLKKLLKLDKCGHTGTLDPNTTGVLVIALNKATKLMSLINEHDKEYKATIIFGLKTDTLDITGNILEETKKIDLVESKVVEAIDKLKKQTKQLPPMYSSIKINGKKLYEYARKGQTIEVVSRDIIVYDIKNISTLYESEGYLCIDIYLHVGKGYYVRSFVRDLANELGIFATMKELERISCGDFHIENSYSLKDIENDNYHIIGIEDLFKDFERLNVNDYLAKLIKNGVVLDERQLITDKPFLVYHNNQLLAIYEVAGKNKYKPLLIFA